MIAPLRPPEPASRRESVRAARQAVARMFFSEPPPARERPVARWRAALAAAWMLFVLVAYVVVMVKQYAR